MGAAPKTARSGVSWGLGDVLLIWVAGWIGAIVAGGVTVSVRGLGSGHDADGIDVAVAVIAQGAAVILAAVVVSRTKGRGTLRADFGLVVRPRDWPWLAVGMVFQVASLLLLKPIMDLAGRNDSAQQSVRALEQAGAPELVVAIFGVVVVAPVAEELLFRGVLLRGLLRRTTPVIAVLASAAIFAGAHLVDPDAALVLVPLLAIGLVSGIRATVTGDLSQSVLLHAGFNLVSAMYILRG